MATEHFIVLDTETTGLDPKTGHRIIEIGAVELIDRKLSGRTYHQYIQPDRKVDEGAFAIHGISDDFLKDKPRFIDILPAFLDFIQETSLVIHNAPFDVGFLNHELILANSEEIPIDKRCPIIDSLAMARYNHPGQRNSLNALCGRYHINNKHRQLHGALLDAEILADVFLAMTGGQVSLLAESTPNSSKNKHQIQRLNSQRPRLLTPKPTDAALIAHQNYLEQLEKSSDGQCLWLHMDSKKI